MCRSSSERRACRVLFVAVVLLAAALRVPDLARRPMHTDEAVHAIKFGALLEDGRYRYDRSEYHGPSLGYLTLVPALLESADTVVEIDEVTVRSVPAFFGIAMVAILPLLAGALGWRVVLAAGLLAAVSPAMVFFSRYYIQEILLAFFTLAAMVAGCRYLRRRSVGWALALGASLGLMHATKETAAVVAASMVAAALLALCARCGSLTAGVKVLRTTDWRHAALMAVVAAAVSALLYSSSLRNPAGVVESYSSYAGFFGKAVGSELHVQPWSYYLRLLSWPGGSSGPVWSEALIVLLAGLGSVAALRRTPAPGIDRDVARFLAAFTAILLVTYSLVPYKTPWNVLVPLLGMILLAGVGVAALVEAAPGRGVRFLCVLLLGAGVFHLGYQAYAGSHVLHSDPANPYVYAHPDGDVVDIAERIQDLAAVHPSGNEMRVDIVGPEGDYWPLPWYLRGMAGVGWWTGVDPEIPAAPVIVVPPALEAELIDKLYRGPPPGARALYVPLFDRYTILRPGVEVRGYVESGLWNDYLRARE